MSVGALLLEHLELTLLTAGLIATAIAYAVSRNLQVTALVALSAAVIWVYGNTLSILPGIWEEQPQYSHGYLVPAFACVLLWLRWQPLGPVSMSERWWGVALIAGSMLLRLPLSFFAQVIPEMVTVIPALCGTFLLVGGWNTLRWSWPALLFLVFMFPLPDAVERGLLDPLQKIATIASTYALQTLGLAAFRDGNRIILGDIKLGVVDACSGLRMLTIFQALTFAIVLVKPMPMWERIVVVLSATPIALAVNIARITVTGVLYVFASKELAETVFHDLAGWVMMPMALGMLYCELQLLDHLVIDDDAVEDLGMGSAGVIPPAAAHS
jgi:exosortase